MILYKYIKFHHYQVFHCRKVTIFCIWGINALSKSQVRPTVNCSIAPPWKMYFQACWGKSEQSFARVDPEAPTGTLQPYPEQIMATTTSCRVCLVRGGWGKGNFGHYKLPSPVATTKGIFKQQNVICSNQNLACMRKKPVTVWILWKYLICFAWQLETCMVWF